jgi:divalent metal cation (Fe/Co/Zn/Cd) transporter
MDEALPAAALARTREIISVNAKRAIEAHDVRIWHAGRMMFTDFHLVVPGYHARKYCSRHLKELSK